MGLVQRVGMTEISSAVLRPFEGDENLNVSPPRSEWLKLSDMDPAYRELSEVLAEVLSVPSFACVTPEMRASLRPALATVIRQVEEEKKEKMASRRAAMEKMSPSQRANA